MLIGFVDRTGREGYHFSGSDSMKVRICAASAAACISSIVASIRPYLIAMSGGK